MLTAEVLQLSSPHVLCGHGQVAKLKLLAKNRKNQMECCFVWECVVWGFLLLLSERNRNALGIRKLQTMK